MELVYGFVNPSTCFVVLAGPCASIHKIAAFAKEGLTRSTVVRHRSLYDYVCLQAKIAKLKREMLEPAGKGGGGGGDGKCTFLTVSVCHEAVLCVMVDRIVFANRLPYSFPECNVDRIVHSAKARHTGMLFMTVI